LHTFDACFTYPVVFEHGQQLLLTQTFKSPNMTAVRAEDGDEFFGGQTIVDVPCGWDGSLLSSSWCSRYRCSR
jgi:hypothetical protein